jgi:hypothetical protein
LIVKRLHPYVSRSLKGLFPSFKIRNLDIHLRDGADQPRAENGVECKAAEVIRTRRAIASGREIYAFNGSTRGYLDPYNVAGAYDGLGVKKRTMEWLERAYRERSASLYGLRNETWSDRLRSDRRFQDLLHHVNFTE